MAPQAIGIAQNGRGNGASSVRRRGQGRIDQANFVLQVRLWQSGRVSRLKQGLRCCVRTFERPGRLTLFVAATGATL